MAHLTVADEQYVFRKETRNKLFTLLIVGVVLVAIGLIVAMSGGGHDAHGEGHAALNSTELVASAQQHGATDQAHATEGHAEGGHHGSPYWLKRLYTTLWMNNVFFTGLGIIGLFFVAIQYAASAGWSAGFLRVPLAMGNWIPIAGIL